MADDQDPASKTEDPTGRRLEHAHERGNVAQSKEIGHWSMMLAALIALMFLSSAVSARLGQALTPFVAAPETMIVDGGGVRRIAIKLGAEVALALAPVVILFLLFGAGASVVQNRPGIAWEKLKPDLTRLSPLKGFRRLFSLASLVELAKNLAKIGVVSSVGLLVVAPRLVDVPAAVTLDTAALVEWVKQLVVLLLSGVLAVMTAIAAADLVYQKVSHLRQLRMSRQEVRDELKQTEGDPMVKARLRSIRLERARRRMMAAVPKADVVVTNPSHYAVALKYDAATMAAPIVVAKGVDELARRIRELALEHKVPLVENPPLARALHAVEVDHEIPPEHYRAVAEVISYVLRLRGRLRAPPAGVSTSQGQRPSI